ncbi:4-hydroxythreonine-4-phosphate dehydrogenase PdxA [bacterium]|nr:4-hydroxythreonine-4-phosphate dehydrogenase PdxA [bacterium]
MHRPTIAISIGDVNGIGPEVILKALSRQEVRTLANFVIIGPEAVLQEHAQRIGVDLTLNVIGNIAGIESLDAELNALDLEWSEHFTPSLGAPSAYSGRIAVEALDAALDLLSFYKVDALVTAPISKKAIHDAGFNYPGHTEWLSEKTNSDAVMVLMHRGFRVGLATNHCALSEVSTQITRQRLIRKLKILSKDLKTRFGIHFPQIAVAALNPHAGENGLFGREEIEVIGPALDEARRLGLAVHGPFPTDSLFARKSQDRFDAYLAMYHDQGLIPVKMFAFGRAVNYTAGLPFVRTSPDHGTAFDIAGKGMAESGSMEEAIKVAARLVSSREAS